MLMNRNRYDVLDGLVSAEVRSEIARAKAVSVKGLAERVGIRRATLSARVNGHAAFTPTLLAAVAAELGTTASRLVARAEQAMRESDEGPRRAA